MDIIANGKHNRKDKSIFLKMAKAKKVDELTTALMGQRYRHFQRYCHGKQFFDIEKKVPTVNPIKILTTEGDLLCTAIYF